MTNLGARPPRMAGRVLLFLSVLAMATPALAGGELEAFLERTVRMAVRNRPVRADINMAYPTAEIAVMGPDGAVNIISRKEIAAAEDGEDKRKELAADYRARFATPFKAAELGFIDEIISPADTRTKIAQALAMLANKKDSIPPKKHGNIPL